MALFVCRSTDNLHYEKFTDGTVKCIEDEIPFEIPESWAWVRLSSLGEIVGGGTPKTSVSTYWDNGNIPWITPADMKYIAGKYIEKGSRNITEDGLKNSSACMMPIGTIIYSSRAPIGYIAITSTSLCTNQGFKSFVPIFTYINNYIYYCLIALTDEIRSRASGTTFKEISGAEFGNTLIPFPPYDEQERIVGQIEKARPFLSEYDTIDISLQKLTLDFSIRLHKSILQWAVRGKLVQQDENDEPASLLLEQVRAEKEELIKQGKIKRNKKAPIIYRGEDNSYYERFADGSEKCIDEEIPFEIPKGWEWTRFSTVITLLSGQDLLSNQYNDTENGIPYITGASNIENGNIIVSRWTDSGRVFAYRGDLLLTCKGTIGEMAVLYAPKAHIARQIMAIRSTETIEIMYIKLVLDSLISTLKEKSKGLIPGITRNDILDSLLPLPSNTEQKRIITCIENLANQLDVMADSLSDPKASSYC